MDYRIFNGQPQSLKHRGEMGRVGYAPTIDAVLEGYSQKQAKQAHLDSNGIPKQQAVSLDYNTDQLEGNASRAINVDMYDSIYEALRPLKNQIHSFYNHRIRDAKEMLPMQTIVRDGQNIHVNDDAGISYSFITTTLTYLQQQVVQAPFFRKTYREMANVTTEGGAAAQNFVYETIKQTGNPVLGQNAIANSVPSSDIQVGRTSFPVYEGIMSYGYNVNELEAQSLTRLSINATRIFALKDSVERNLDIACLLGFQGDDTYHAGLYNYEVARADGTYINIPYAWGDGTVPTWTTAVAPPDCATLVEYIIQARTEASQRNGNRFSYDTLILPNLHYGILQTQYGLTETGRSGLQYLREQTQMRIYNGDWHLDNIVARPLSDPTDRKSRILIRSSEVGLPTNRFNITLPLQFLAPQVQGYGFKVYTRHRFVPTIVYYPQSMIAIDTTVWGDPPIIEEAYAQKATSL